MWDQTEFYPAGIETALVQELYDKGLIFLANQNALHHFGYALGVVVDADEKVIGITLHKTNDPDGIWFDEESTIRGRRKFLDHLTN